MKENLLSVSELPPLPVSKLKILILDDDDRILLLLRSVLKSKFDVIGIKNTSELIDCAESEKPNLILLDLNMPNIDGFEVLSMAKSHTTTSEIPILCISADNSEETRARIKKLGACGFIKKPFKNNSLVSDIEAILESLNETITSQDSHRKFIITYSENEKYNLIHRFIEKESRDDEVMVFLSWMSAENFLNDFERELVKQDKLIYLQIKPSLIVKFPYIQEISPVFHDISMLLPNTTKSTHLIFDELRNILNVYDQERALAKTYSLSAMLQLTHKKSTLFNTRPVDASSESFLDKMARIFSGDKG